MRATIWAGRNSVEVQSVPDPKSSTSATRSYGSR